MIALFAEDPSVQKHMAKVREVFIPATVIGKLFFGKEIVVHKKSYPGSLYFFNNSLDANNDMIKLHEIWSCLCIEHRNPQERSNDNKN